MLYRLPISRDIPNLKDQLIIFQILKAFAGALKVNRNDVSRQRLLKSDKLTVKCLNKINPLSHCRRK